MKSPTNCPHCGANLQGDLVYQTFLDKYKDPVKAKEVAAMYGATETEGRWGKAIGIYDNDLDRTVAYRCPECEKEWPREV